MIGFEDRQGDFDFAGNKEMVVRVLVGGDEKGIMMVLLSFFLSDFSTIDGHNFAVIQRQRGNQIIFDVLNIFIRLVLLRLQMRSTFARGNSFPRENMISLRIHKILIQIEEVAIEISAYNKMAMWKPFLFQ